MGSAPNGRSFGQWKVLQVCQNAAESAELSALLGEYMPFAPVTELKEYPGKQLLSELIEDQGISLCFIDVESNPDWAFALLAELSTGEVKIPAVALLRTNDADQILRSLRAGASEFMVQPFTVEQFVPVMERVCQQFRGKAGLLEAKLVAVMPAKGACGASTLAVTLASQWKKLGASKVLLADLDPYTGTISFQLKMKQVYNFLEALNRTGQMDEDIWKGLVAQAGGMDIMLSPEQPAHGIEDLHNPATILEFARTLYEAVIVDTNGVYGTWNLGVAQTCDEVLLVTTNDLPALQSTQRAIAYLERSHVERSKIKVVVNRFTNDLGLNRELIETALHGEIFQLVPSDPEEVQKSVVDGKPLPVTSAAGKAIQQIAEKLAGKKAKPAVPPAPKTSSIGKLLSFMQR